MKFVQPLIENFLLSVYSSTENRNAADNSDHCQKPRPANKELELRLPVPCQRQAGGDDDGRGDAGTNAGELEFWSISQPLWHARFKY